MKYIAGQRRKALEYEKDLVQVWKQNKTFDKSVEQRDKNNAYVFYDGPPFITGIPHHGTLLSSVVKDTVPRYWTMQGKRVERVWGWDCHGLPAEVFTEKKLGIQDRRDIGTKISLETYITTCRDNMVQTGNLWEDTIDRIGRWVDFRGAYKTMDKPYMESVWWAFKELYDQHKIYEGERVLLYCTRDATPLSKAEVTMDAGSYQDVTDPSVYVKFKLKNLTHEGKPVYLLAWTTTPWTLPANTAVGVGSDETYSQIELDNGEVLIILSALLEKVLTDEKHQPIPFTFIQSIPGNQLVGQEYEPLLGIDRGDNAHKIWDYPGLSSEEGTGIVHLAPAYGEEDYQLSKAEGFPFVNILDDSGFYTEGDWQGQNVWEANKPIAKELHARGVVWKIHYYRHSYPHCYRCGTRLMYRAHPSWFMDIQGQKPLMLEENEKVNWFPAHLKEGRFKKNIEQAPDWNLSRDRFWATAMPVWKGRDSDGREHIKVVGSYAELQQLSGIELEDYHRPWVDDIEFDLDGIHYTRIDKVMDCWFESGSMPFAQFHYPFENKEKFERSFPGQFITEYVGQVRAWFYYVHAVNTALFGKNAFQNVITTGVVAGNDGRKMSKSYGNYTDPNELMDMYSADALRYTLLASPLLNAEDFALQDKFVQDVQRKLAMIWNMYDFFTTYAAVDAWEWGGSLDDPSTELHNALDIWVVSRLHQLQSEMTEHMNGYDIVGALDPVLPFLDDASNWYVRRSRRRFWKSGDDTDKHEAYTTLHYVLVRLSLLLAPFVPFLSEELFQKLTGGEAGESVHLLDWPAAGAVDTDVIERMSFVREVINQGLSDRAVAKLKVRQPLAAARVFVQAEMLAPSGEMIDIIREELNVKVVEIVVRQNVDPDKSFTDNWEARKDTMPGRLVELDTELTPELKQEGLMRELVRQIQTARKVAGLNVDDRITLSVTSDASELTGMLHEHAKAICDETLAVSLNENEPDQYAATVKVDGFTATIKLAKA